MTRRFRRLALVACALTIPLLTSGCAILKFSGYGGGPLGTARQSVEICASGPNGGTQNYKCEAKGNIGLDATSGFRQLLVGARVPAGVGAPGTITTQPPQSLTFSASPGYAAELQRLDPAPAGQKWVGWISPSLNYSDALNSLFAQRATLTTDWQLPSGADGSPYSAGTLTAHWVVGIRNVTQTATAARPVVCGDSLTTAFPDSQDPNQYNVGYVFCEDSALDLTSPVGDLGVVTANAKAAGTPGSVVSMPFALRSGNVDKGVTPLPIHASTTLPGATVALPQATIPQPPKDGDSPAVVAIGIPADAAPGVYDVTFTVDMVVYGDGVTRTGVGRLTVLPAPPGAGGGGGVAAATKRTLTAVLAKGLSVTDARAHGLPVVLGSTVAGPALVRLQQGPKRRPALSIGKRVRLKAPGPVKVTFRSRKLVKGPYRLSILIAGKVVKTASGRLAK